MFYRWCFFALSILCVLHVESLQAQLVIGGDPRVDPDDFRITTFASGLNYPVGMVQLADGSVLVAVSKGSAFFGSSSGQLVRLVDSDDDGQADQQTVLVDNVPGGGLSALRMAGDLAFTCGQGRGKPISIYRAGATPADPLTLVGSIEINYTGSWLHPHSALAVRPTPGQANSYDLVFHLGSEVNFAKTERTLSLTSTIGVEGELNGDSVYMVTITDDGETVSGSNLTQLATGLRSAAGYAFHPDTGDLYLQTNGIDGLVDVNEAHSADEINVIAAADIGGEVEDFGFPDNYTAYRTGEFVGGGGIPPLVAFLPLPDPQTGNESEGPNDIAFAPPGFPPGLNKGLFVGFHGKFGLGGLSNEENPLIYVDLEAGTYFHFVEVDRPEVGHLDGLLATDRDLFVADISPRGGFGNSAGNSGIIYQIRSLRDHSTAVEEVGASALPTAISLGDAQPNPFNPATTIEFSIPSDAADLPLTLKVYNLSGQTIATLAQQTAKSGVFQVQWDGRDQSGRAVASGVYLYKLHVGHHVLTAKLMTLLK